MIRLYNLFSLATCSSQGAMDSMISLRMKKMEMILYSEGSKYRHVVKARMLLGSTQLHRKMEHRL